MANSTTFHRFSGSADFAAGDDPCYLTIRADGPFSVFRIDENSDRILLGPDSDSDRVFYFFLKPAESIYIKAAKRVTVFVEESHLPNPAEVVSSESLVEIIPVHEMSAIDRLRAEMLSSISALSEDRGHDSLEDEDYEDDFDDDDVPLTPYEYSLMHEEYLAAQQDADLPQESTLDDNNNNAPASAEVATHSSAGADNNNVNLPEADSDASQSESSPRVSN